MREFKALIITCVALAFIGGVGLGTWVGSLRAASPPATRSLERRMTEWTTRYDLTPSQARLIRGVLAGYDGEKSKIQSELDAEHWKRIYKLRDISLHKIDKILAETAPATPGIGG